MARDLVVIGGSAGALEALKRIVADLPLDLPAAVLVVIHMPATGPSLLASLLDRVGGLRAMPAHSGDPLMAGTLYAAIPDHHLKLHDSHVLLDRGPTVNGVRPAVDVLFESAAATFGPRTVGVVLSGGLDDGTAGLAAIRAAGGVGVVQAPEDAIIPAMPSSAIRRAAPEHVAAAARLGEIITRLVTGDGPVERPRNVSKGGEERMEAVGAEDNQGLVTGLTCPDCNGSLWADDAGGTVTFRCRIGHAYSPDTMVDRQAMNVDSALWAGVRALEEQVSLARHLASGARRRQDTDLAERHQARAAQAKAEADALRRLLTERD